MSPATDPVIAAFAAQISALKKQVAAVSRAQSLIHSSLENGALREHAADGTLRSVIGKQHDGTSAAAVLTGPIPPCPSAPTATSGTGSITVAWDSTFRFTGNPAVDNFFIVGPDGNPVSPMDWARVDVHVSQTDGFTPDTSSMSATYRASFAVEKPSIIQIPQLAAGVWYVKLVTATTSAAFSPPTTEASATSIQQTRPPTVADVAALWATEGALAATGLTVQALAQYPIPLN